MPQDSGINSTPVVTQIAPSGEAQNVLESTLTGKSEGANMAENITLSAHELRTILTVMRNYLWVSQYQKEEPIGPKVGRNLHIVTYALEHLIGLVENTLLVARIEKGSVMLMQQEADLVEITNTIIAKYSEKAISAGISLVFDTSIAKAPVLVDRAKCVDAISYIVDNALKFTPRQGRITFKVLQSEDELRHELTIEDTGPGIPKHLQKNLFAKYGKIDESYVGLPGGRTGAGLGLFIAAKLMQMQSGDISIQSDAGAGTKCVVSLPISGIQPHA